MHKILKSLSLAAVLSLASLSVQAQMPTFYSSSASGTTAASVLFPFKPTTQVRVVSTIATSDLSTSKITMYSGSTARYIAFANTNTAATQLILDSTNGLSGTNSLLYLALANTNIVALMTNVTTTNIVVGSATNTYGLVTMNAAVGFAQPLNGEVELLGNSIVLGLGANTNKVYASDGLYVGFFGRAVYITTTGTSNCSLDSVTVHYDSSSQ